MSRVDTKHAYANGPAETETQDRGVAALIKEIRDDALHLMRQETQLARTEMSEKLSRTIRALVGLMLGGGVAFAGAIVVLMALGEGLGLGLNAAGMAGHGVWIGPLLVGLVAGIIGLLFTARSKAALDDESIVPERTVQSIKENAQWVKQKTN